MTLDYKNSTALTQYEADDGWNDAAAEYADNLTKGEFLKCSEGFWTVGKEGSPLQPGLRLVATGTNAAWRKWANNKPILGEDRIRRSGERFPEREELGDLDETKWELSPDKKTPRDPWQNTRFCYFVNPENAQVYTWSTASWTGRGAINGLADQILRMRTARPGALPIVEFESAPHKNPYRMTRKPVLKVVGWVGGNGDLTAAAPEIKKIGGPKGGAAAAPVVTDDMDDEVPFFYPPYRSTTITGV